MALVILSILIVAFLAILVVDFFTKSKDQDPREW